jgi:hypothetical protein
MAAKPALKETMPKAPGSAARRPRRRAVTGSLFKQALGITKLDGTELLRALYRLRHGRAPGGEAVIAGARAALQRDDRTIGAQIGPGGASEPEVAFGVCVGAGLACRLEGKQQVVLCCCRAADTASGAFPETLRLAAEWRLPVIFVCENDQPASAAARRSALKPGLVLARAHGYGGETASCDGTNVLEVREAVEAACFAARHGKGPVLIEALTCRGPQAGAQVPPDELAYWQARDPIAKFRVMVAEADAVSPAQADAIEKDVAAEFSGAPRAAKKR